MGDASARRHTGSMSAGLVETGANGWDRRRERVSREIERAALTLFAKERPQEVTIEQIAAAAGISMRTFFRYFASRDEILAALPRRKLEQVSALVRDRPAQEGLIEAFSAAIERAQELNAESDMVLLWGIAIHRSPESAMMAMAHCAVSMSDSFEMVIAERLGVDRSDIRAGALAAALSGLIGFAYSQWVLQGGTGSLATKLADAFAVLAELR